MDKKQKLTIIDEEIALAREEFRKATDTQAKGAAFDRMEKLLKLKFEETKTKNDHWDRWIKHSLEAMGILLPLGFYHLWMHRGLEFEKTGSITSGVFRGLTKFFRPTR